MKFPVSIFWAFCNLPLLYFGVSDGPAHSQSIQIDGTTPTTISPEITGDCQSTCTISGGNNQGNNLFHSFKKFDINSGATVLFVDPGVQNILSRVTSKSPSRILGTLGVFGGDANLFLLNPNGILFGPNASLSLNGSFIATTANAIQFGDQGFFSASTSEIPNITINPSALFFQAASGSIENNSSNGLSVSPGRSLHLIGGDVILNNGKINTFGGHIELGGLAGSGVVNIFTDAEGFSLEFPHKSSKANVILSGANIDVIGEGGGNITITANTIKIERSILLAGIEAGSGSNLTQAGNIEFNALESVTVSSRSLVLNSLFSNSIGQGGDIIVNSKNLFLNDESFLATGTLGKGNAGNVVIQSSEKVLLDSGFILSNVDTFGDFKGIGNGGQIFVKTGKLILDNQSVLGSGTFGTGNAGDVVIDAKDISLKSTSAIASTVQEGAVGNGGKIKIYTDTLSLTGGSQLTASIQNAEDELSGGKGQGGDILVEASKSVILSGFSETSGDRSGFLVATEEGANGLAGTINIKARTLRITDGAIVSAQTLNQSQGGDIAINSTNFEALNGGQIVSTTFSAGNAGNIKLNVTGDIVLAGQDINFDRRLNLLQDFLLEDGVEPDLVETQIQDFRDIGPNSGLYASATSGASGKAGNISVDPRFVLIQDGARISVNNEGSGPGGSIFLQAGNLTLDRGTISATSSSNQGGNIDLSLMICCC